MKKTDSIILKIFLYGLPVVIVLAMLQFPFRNFKLADYAPVLHGASGFVFMTWLLLSIYLSVRLITSEALREKVLARLTLRKERDEREEQMSGKATRSAFLATTAILITLFFFSCLQVSAYRVEPQYAVGGKTGFLTIGFGLYIKETSKCNKDKEAEGRKYIISYNGLPVSSSVVLLVIILWQVFYYNYSMRRMLR